MFNYDKSLITVFMFVDNCGWCSRAIFNPHIVTLQVFKGLFFSVSRLCHIVANQESLVRNIPLSSLVFPKDQPNDKITKIIYKIHFSVLVDYFHKYLYAT